MAWNNSAQSTMDLSRLVMMMQSALHKNATIHQVTTTLTTSKMSYFQVLTTGADDSTL